LSEKPTHLAVDAMGGDFGPRIPVSAALQYIKQKQNITLSLFGEQRLMDEFLEDADAETLSRVTVVHCTETVTMDDKPSSVARHKRGSSMWQALTAVADNRADACVSAGNTGALMAMACLTIKTLPGIDRPAICAALPTPQGHCYLLDLGANLDCSATQLYQLA